MMIRLEVPNRYLNGGILLYDIFDRANASSEPEKLEDNNPFEKVSFPLNIEDSSIEQDNEHILVEAIKDICRQRLRASVIEDNGSYSRKGASIMRSLCSSHEKGGSSDAVPD